MTQLHIPAIMQLMIVVNGPHLEARIRIEADIYV